MQLICVVAVCDSRHPRATTARGPRDVCARCDSRPRLASEPPGPPNLNPRAPPAPQHLDCGEKEGGWWRLQRPNPASQAAPSAADGARAAKPRPLWMRRAFWLLRTVRKFETAITASTQPP